ncbi:hypothetical protein JW968_04390 [Candidatus Woesearchaeota archaeon]|nr:hypothetical protein [Candidatus Woesearchaeota archaeon]
MRHFFVFFILMMVVFAVGCENGQDSGSDDGQDDGTDGMQDDSAAEKDDPGTGDGKSKSYFLDTLGKSPSYKATYDFTGSAEEISTLQEYTLYFKDEDKFRSDITATAEGRTMTMMFFMLDKQGYFCIDQGQIMCFEQPNYEPPQGEQIVDDIKDNPDMYSPVYDGTVTIAGKKGECWKVDVQQGSSSRICFSSDGVLLLSEVTMPDGTFKMTAKSIGSVSDSDFVLPAQPQDFEMPGYPGMG